MRTLEIAEAEVMQVAIRQEIDRSEESRYDYRLHGVLLVASGRSCTAVLSGCATASAREAQVAGRTAEDASGA